MLFFSMGTKVQRTGRDEFEENLLAIKKTRDGDGVSTPQNVPESRTSVKMWKVIFIDGPVGLSLSCSAKMDRQKRFSGNLETSRRRTDPGYFLNTKASSGFFVHEKKILKWMDAI